jgi:L-aminopeptidase/D-esterase-like protein
MGVGAGATVGKLFGIGKAMKGGVGFSSFEFCRAVKVQALAVVNAFGDVIDPEDGGILAGARK